MKKMIVVIAVLCTLPCLAADPVEEVRQAETSFARAFAERDSEAFFSHVLDDATFMGDSVTLGGKKAVAGAWSRLLAMPDAPFSWGPERVVVNGSGTVALSAGPVYDRNLKHIGNFSSVWLKQPDGSWKVLFDGPGGRAAAFAAEAVTVEEGFLEADDGTRLHYRKAGKGPFTLIVPLDFVLFDDFKQLVDLATVIAYDPRGRGRSDRPKDPTSATIQQEVRDLEAVRRHFAVEKFIPVGHSYLGPVVALYALKHAQRVSRLIQLSPARIGAAMSDPALSNDELTRITAPALVIHGMKDRNVAYGSGREWAMRMPNAVLITIEGGTHQAWIDDPARVFGAIRAFIRRDLPLAAEKVTTIEPQSSGD